MKALRIIGNVLIGIILFALIFALSFTRSTKNFLEKDVILSIIKGTITNTIKNESDKITNKSEELLDNMFQDDDTNDIIRMVIDNFDKYQDNSKNFKVSDQDLEKIVSFATKYKKTIIEISGDKIKDISDEEFKKIFSSENINKVANELFSSIEGDVGEGIDTLIKTYNKVTSNEILLVLIGAIVFFILLLFLINWSLYKWMLITGIDLIVSSLFMIMIFMVGFLLRENITKVDVLKETVGKINLNGYALWGGIELLIGIILIIVYNVINNKYSNEAKEFQRLDGALNNEIR